MGLLAIDFHFMESVFCEQLPCEQQLLIELAINSGDFW
jgi:hypothetical protein